SDRRLLDLEYRPKFRREMSLFGVFGISFWAIEILNGMSSTIGGLLNLLWGWD
ncbi:hypothetical protein DFH29DRAFT_759526, partial [Suillus ampliporus]